MRADYYCAILGGGYAGLAAARELALRGMGPRTLLVDRRGRAGYPPASTSGIAGKWLRQYGLVPDSDGLSARIRTFRLVAPDGHARLLEAAPGVAADSLGSVLNEPNFLGRIEAEVVRAGVTVWHSTHVARAISFGMGRAAIVGLRDNETPPGRVRLVTARYAIACDGYNSAVGRDMGLTTALPPDSFHGGVEITVPNAARDPDDQIVMWLGHDVAPRGYVWSFPSTEDGIPCRRVGIGTPMSVRPAAATWFRRFLDHHPEYDLKPHHRVGGIIPTYFPPRRIHDGRIALAGDALRLCDPVTGGGIAPAIISGVEAARALTDDLDFSGYPARVSFLLKELRVRYVLKQLLYSLNDRELSRFVDLLADYPLPTAGEVDPFVERRRFTRYALRHGLGVFARLLYRGRLREAFRPWF